MHSSRRSDFFFVAHSYACRWVPVVLSDFGDMVRTATNAAAEDEANLSLVEARLPIFSALAEGYLSSAHEFLNPVERSLLVFAGRLSTCEQGIRFLSDYLAGDTYFN